MRVGIFETTHFEGAYPVIRLFDNGQNEITIFCYQESYKQFKHLFGDQPKRYNWVVRKDSESKYQFIRRIYIETRQQKLELLYLNTITDNFIFYWLMIRSLPEVRIVMTLHAINTFFAYYAPFHFRKLIRTIGKKRLTHAVKEFNVVALTMVEYLKARLPATKSVYAVPGAVYEGRTNQADHDSLRENIRIVVPGMVDARRRNYFQVLELLQQCKEQGLNVSITLLGGYVPQFGKDILEKIKASATDSLKFYESAVVDQPEFDEVMDKAHLVFIPSTINVAIMDDVPEIYGLTMSSGNLFDIIKHAKPYIAPTTLRVDPFLEPSRFAYESISEVVNWLHSIANSPEIYLHLLRHAREASSHYTIEAVRNRNRQLFGQL